jgi:hypothetical protein
VARLVVVRALEPLLLVLVVQILLLHLRDLTAGMACIAHLHLFELLLVVAVILLLVLLLLLALLRLVRAVLQLVLLLIVVRLEMLLFMGVAVLEQFRSPLLGILFLTILLLMLELVTQQ